MVTLLGMIWRDKRKQTADEVSKFTWAMSKPWPTRSRGKSPQGDLITGRMASGIKAV